MRNIITIIAITLSLQSCFLVGAAAGAAGIALVYDHRKVERVIDDQTIAKKVYDKIRFNPAFKDSTHINVTSFNGIVLLTGEATSANLRQEAETLAKTVPNVERVYNEVAIKGPSSSLTRTSDAWITAKNKSLMLAEKDLASGSIKVVTENGSVYLMGLVTRDQAETAVDVARQAAGVQKVVKIFQYK